MIPYVDKAPGGKGVCAQRLPTVFEISDWFTALADRLKRVIVLNRDWQSAVTSSILADTPTASG